MNNWPPRAIRGAFFAVIGICAFQVQPILMQVTKGSPFWHGLSQAGMSIIGVLGVTVGGYYLVTRYRK